MHDLRKLGWAMCVCVIIVVNPKNETLERESELENLDFVPSKYI